MAVFEEDKKMGDRAEYRSAIRSRKLIRDAFLRILQENGTARMTVTEIVRRADINRATFYAHYPDVQGVIDEIENEVLGKVFDVLQPEENGDFLSDLPKLFRNINSYIEENIESFRILVKANESLSFIEKMKDILVKFMLENQNIPAPVRQSENYHLICIYFIGGLMSLYKEWLLGNIDCSLNTLAIQCETILATFAATFSGANN